MLERATGKNVLVQEETPLQGDVPLTWADLFKAERLPGCWPQTSLEERKDFANP